MSAQGTAKQKVQKKKKNNVTNKLKENDENEYDLIDNKRAVERYRKNIKNQVLSYYSHSSVAARFQKKVKDDFFIKNYDVKFESDNEEPQIYIVEAKNEIIIELNSSKQSHQKYNEILNHPEISQIFNELCKSEEEFIRQIDVISRIYKSVIVDCKLYFQMCRLYLYVTKFRERLENCNKFSDIPETLLKMKNTLLYTYEIILKDISIAIKCTKQQYYKNKIQNIVKYEKVSNVDLTYIMRRLISYCEILKRIRKELYILNLNEEMYTQCINCIVSILKKGDTHAALHCIDNAPFTIDDTGLFILNGDFLIKNKERKFKGTLFLFERCIVITKRDTGQDNNYIFVDQLDFMNVSIAIRERKYSIKITKQWNGKTKTYWLSNIYSQSAHQWHNKLNGLKRRISVKVKSPNKWRSSYPLMQSLSEMRM